MERTAWVTATAASQLSDIDPCLILAVIHVAEFVEHFAQCVGRRHDQPTSASRAELSNIPMSAAWPTIARMFEALTYDSAGMRGLAVERAVDDMTKIIGECRQRIHACNRLAEERAEEERKAAEEEAGERKRLALVG